MNTKPTHPMQLMKAHQFLYYQGRAVWSDQRYDQFCKEHGLDGVGGSDLVGDYTLDEKELAARIEANPHLYL